uniref:Uncharacterized protein n=1 Tax=Rhizophora mucronata TaxID=61149 RepID=A0A2P2M4M5_RHIMU
MLIINLKHGHLSFRDVFCGSLVNKPIHVIFPQVLQLPYCITCWLALFRVHSMGLTIKGEILQ